MKPQKEEIPQVTNLFKKRQEKGLAKIIPFSIKLKDDPLYFLRNAREPWFMRVYDGKFVKLIVDGELMMSDTNMERVTNLEFVRKAHGHVFIAGLGLGLIIQAILKKKEVLSVTVVEKYQDVIDLVKPKFKDRRLTIVQADIFEYKPDKKYDVVYFDIWPTISPDNLKEMAILSRRFQNSMNKSNPNRWKNSWLKEYLQKIK